MTKFILAGVAAVLASLHGADASVLFESLPDKTTGSALASGGGSTAVGRLTVSSQQVVGAIGVLNNLPNGAILKFFIANASTGALLFLSGPKAFAAQSGQDLNLTYKVSDALSFTFVPGLTYAVGSIADNASYTYVDGFQSNTAHGFTSLIGNETVSNYAAPVVNAGVNCCNVGFELLDAALPVPEPGSLALLGAGLLGLGAAARRRG